MTNDTTPTGPAAVKTVEEWAHKIVDALHYERIISRHDRLFITRLMTPIIEQAMAQAHAAGREEAADIVEARSLLHDECDSGCIAALALKESAERIRALRTASAQPTATEASGE